MSEGTADRYVRTARLQLSAGWERCAVVVPGRRFPRLRGVVAIPLTIALAHCAGDTLRSSPQASLVPIKHEIPAGKVESLVMAAKTGWVVAPDLALLWNEESRVLVLAHWHHRGLCAYASDGGVLAGVGIDTQACVAYFPAKDIIVHHRDSRAYLAYYRAGDRVKTRVVTTVSAPLSGLLPDVVTDEHRGITHYVDLPGRGDVVRLGRQYIDFPRLPVETLTVARRTEDQIVIDQPRSGGSTVLSRRYGGVPLVAVGNNGTVATANSAEYSISVVSSATTDTVEIHRAVVRQPLSFLERLSAGRAARALARQHGDPAIRERLAPPKYKAPLSRLWVDATERIWVGVSGADGEVAAVDVYERSGRSLGRFALGRGLRVFPAGAEGASVVGVRRHRDQVALVELNMDVR
jgi:hypothetical protein